MGQTDAFGPQGNLVGNADCECNYKLKNNGRSDWYRQWLSSATPKKGFEWQQWFGKGKAPSFALDIVSCWVDNPRDMIELQNQIWWNRYSWSNQMVPSSSWDDKVPWSLRRYC